MSEQKNSVIMTSHLSKYYGKNRGIEDISLTVEEGDFFGCIGPNGAGKSTLIRTLMGLISATAGKAEIFGMDMKKHKIRILEEVGYLPSEVTFYEGLKVKDILRLSASLRKKDCEKEAEFLCRRLDLDMEKKTHQLSLGNRKKLGIVCAMQYRPRLYVLDEPTSGLDPLIQREFYALLKERNEEGATIFLSSHILSEVQQYCRHAGIIREGRLLVSDTVERLGHTGVKRVTLRGASGLPVLAGMRDIKPVAKGVSFLYSGKAHVLLKALAEFPVEDVVIAEPSLEEVFMHYYTKEESGSDNGEI